MPRPSTKNLFERIPWLPNSTPDWQWRYAMNLVESNRNFSEPRDGPEIGRLTRYVRAARADFIGRRYEKAIDADPFLHQAVRFKSSSWMQPLELQCRVLAGQSAAVIGVELGLPRQVVEAFCLAFFDVAHRLDQRTFIVQRVIGIEPNKPSSCEALMMLSAYNRGPHSVDLWLDWWDHQGEIHDLNTPVGRMRERIELFVAAQNLTLNKETCFKLTKLASVIFKIRPKMPRRRSVSEIISENTSRKLLEVSWPEKPEGVSKKNTAANRQHDNAKTT
jgi:hypothetical protein